MTQLEQRVREKKWKLLHKETIHGTHAGHITRIEVVDGDNERGMFIYKEFAENRENEVDIYLKIKKHMKKFSKVVEVWDEAPKAILMSDLSSPLKDSFQPLSLKEKKKVLQSVLQRLSDLHTSEQPLLGNQLKTHTITFEWRRWCLDELTKLCANHQWVQAEWIHTINHAYEQLSFDQYEVRGPYVLTHGDPHLENIFQHEGEIWFIDWEWASLGSPLRDITILLQDVYDIELIQFVFLSYRSLLEEKKLIIGKEDYQKDFKLLYVDHTTMMLAWEIHKYFEGYAKEEEMKRIIEFKVGEIKRIAFNKTGESNTPELDI
ncbi:hypothetical protein FGG79_14290 [Bacillus sp. BHET2]|uniref:phosphotransferase family protein n=1 Tax=Bacillus sp. BHET2 TaxID=2583818 RepID=UPI00148656FD|nr:phosphotransferase [Bacillus sp. BHET2]TMU85058.1 hypothetical protein FGG79_14290 [Bacillus sp. BHET2]